ncbi:MAG TPA: OmpA family protein [Acidocella sp.]|jgi:outer membrane protein OmpA-like peptidoglycan-associated protein|nr:OmpA family protein [Acidocella sp.]
MKFRMTLLAAGVLAAPFALPTLAQAQPVTGAYVSGGLGYNIESSQKGKNVILDNTTQKNSVRILTHNGWTGEASVGYGFGNGFRVELEGDYYSNNFSKTKFPTQIATSGKEQKYGVFANGLYDFDVGLPYLFPYLGAGIGYQKSYFNGYEAGTVFINKARPALAYQGIAGLAFPIPAVPGLSATIEYRFMALTGSRKYNGADFVAGRGATNASYTVGSQYNNSIMVGLRYQLYTPPPPPPPAPAPVAAPAPAPAQTYLVFFDWDKYNLTPRAVQIIAQAAEASHSQNVTRLNVSGYTDTSGTPRYNLGLSIRRAKAVAAQLVADGVPSSEIEIHGFGQTHLLVPTGPGVREPQNRRVEIVLQ